VQSYLCGLTLGEFLAGLGLGLGVLGLGMIAMGLVGASITYMRFGVFELIKVPLHASVVGLSLCVIYFTSRWRCVDRI
jgi:hypothetical protein